MSHASFFKVLGLPPTASETAVRSRFKLLALSYHPDKTTAVNKAVATDRFVEIRHAYEYCISHLDPDPEEEDFEEEDDDEDWRGKLPTGIFNANAEWWDELKGNEPRAILKWAEACQNALRSAAVNLDKAEQRKLNASYLTAYENFEKWRRKHIERPAEEERMQQDISALPERLQVHVRRALEAKRAQEDYCYDNYQEDHDEEQYFWEDEFDFWGQEAIAEPMVLPTDTWRDNHNSYESRTTPLQRLQLFDRQNAAVEKRNLEWKEQGIVYYDQAEMDRRAMRRKATRDRYLEEIVLSQKKGLEYERIRNINKVKRVGPFAKANADELIEGVVPRVLGDGPKDEAVPHGLQDVPEDGAA
jgi:hypothetical protein